MLVVLWWCGARSVQTFGSCSGRKISRTRWRPLHMHRMHHATGEFVCIRKRARVFACARIFLFDEYPVNVFNSTTRPHILHLSNNPHICMYACIYIIGVSDGDHAIWSITSCKCHSPVRARAGYYCWCCSINRMNDQVAHVHVVIIMPLCAGTWRRHRRRHHRRNKPSRTPWHTAYSERMPCVGELYGQLMHARRCGTPVVYAMIAHYASVCSSMCILWNSC